MLLNRPFDDQSQHRVAIKSAAIGQVLELIEDGTVSDHSSEMAGIEIERIPDPERRRKVSALLPPNDRIIPLTDDLLEAAEHLTRIGFGLADAVHLCAARQLEFDVFLTVDDKLLKRAKRFTQRVKVRVIDPATFLMELKDDHDR